MFILIFIIIFKFTNLKKKIKNILLTQAIEYVQTF